MDTNVDKPLNDEKTKPKMPPVPFIKKQVEENLVKISNIPDGFEANDQWIKPLGEEYVSRWSQPK